MERAEGLLDPLALGDVVDQRVDALDRTVLGDIGDVGDVRMTFPVSIAAEILVVDAFTGKRPLDRASCLLIIFFSQYVFDMLPVAVFSRNTEPLLIGPIVEAVPLVLVDI